MEGMGPKCQQDGKWVYTHWGGAGNVGAGGDHSVYRPPLEHGCIVHCESSYHGLVSSGGAEAGTAYIQAMVGADRPGYTGDKGRACIIGGGEEMGKRESEGEGE